MYYKTLERKNRNRNFFCEKCELSLKKIKESNTEYRTRDSDSYNNSKFQIINYGGDWRQKLYSLICRTPGLHFREIQRRTKMATGHLIYHLERLCNISAINTKKDGKYLRYYTYEQIENEEIRVIELIRQESVRKILKYLLDNDISNHKKIVDNVGLSASTTSWHLKKLVKEKILGRHIRGRKSYYCIIDPKLVGQVFEKYMSSF